MNKHIILTLSLLLYTICAFAEIEYVQGSFREIGGETVSASGSDIGYQNMTALATDNWELSADGEDINGKLVVSFENFSPEEIREITISRLSNRQIPIIDKNLHENKGVITRWFYLPESSKPFDIDFVHPKYGTTRISGVTIGKHKIYRATLRAQGKVSVAITSTPSGATVIFDTQRVGQTPLTIPDVTLGKHNIVLEVPNRNMAADYAGVIDVSLTNTTFDFNLMRKKNVEFVAEPLSAVLNITKNGMSIARDKGRFNVNNLEYGTYVVKGYLGGDDNETTVEINDRTPGSITIKVVPSSTITFNATQNNYPVSGAKINLDNVYIGETPLTQKVDYGVHKVDMSYYGYQVSKSFTVGKGKSTNINLKLPNRLKSRHNIFDIDYKRREWGMAFNYVNRAYTLKMKGSPATKYNFYLDEGHHENGIQMGMTYQGYYGYGQGINTGLYWQMMFGDWYGESSCPMYIEHSLYIPIQYQFRLPISSRISFFANAGIAMNIGLSNTVSIDGEDYSLGYGYNDEYDLLFPKAFDCSMLFGGGVQFGVFQLEAKYSKSFINQTQILEMNGIEDGSFKASSWQVGCSFLF